MGPIEPYVKSTKHNMVYPKYRKQGLSYQVLDYATKTVGCKNLAVSKSNKIAKHTYDKYGFKTTEQDSDYYYMSK